MSYSQQWQQTIHKIIITRRSVASGHHNFMAALYIELRVNFLAFGPMFTPYIFKFFLWDGKWSLTIFIFPGMFHYRGECVRHIPRHSGRSRSQGSDECYQSQSCQSRDINYVCVGGGEHVGRCRCRDDMKVNQW